MQTQFSYTTRQAARALNVSIEALRAQYQRSGHFRGIKPKKLPNNRMLWPRGDVLAAAGQHLVDRRTVVDVRATDCWLNTLGYHVSDPMAGSISIALNDPRDDTTRDVQEQIDSLFALGDWVAASDRRLHAARSRMSPAQWTDAQRQLARAIAPAVASLPPELLAQAVSESFGQ